MRSFIVAELDVAVTGGTTAAGFRVILGDAAQFIQQLRNGSFCVKAVARQDSSHLWISKIVAFVAVSAIFAPVSIQVVIEPANMQCRAVVLFAADLAAEELAHFRREHLTPYPGKAEQGSKLGEVQLLQIMYLQQVPVVRCSHVVPEQTSVPEPTTARQQMVNAKVKVTAAEIGATSAPFAVLLANT